MYSSVESCSRDAVTQAGMYVSLCDTILNDTVPK